MDKNSNLLHTNQPIKFFQSYKQKLDPNFIFFEENLFLQGSDVFSYLLVNVKISTPKKGRKYSEAFESL